MAETRRVLRFSDGSAKLADPALYIPPSLMDALIPGTNVDPAITRAFQTALAAAMTTAAAKSAASTKTSPG